LYVIDVVEPVVVIVEFAGVTAIELIVGAVTVRVVVPLIDPDVALMVAVPTAAPVAVLPLKVTSPAGDADQVAVELISALLPSL
jgi:hypothetical protein